MPPKRPYARDIRPILARLRVLEGAERTAYGLEVIAGSRDPEVLLAALAALEEGLDARARGQLAGVYASFDADGKRRDASGTVRAAIVRALTPGALPADLPLFLRASTTFEPTPQERGGPALLRDVRRGHDGPSSRRANRK